MGSTSINNNTLDGEVIVLLKYLSNFQISLKFAIVKICILSEIRNTSEIVFNSAFNPTIKHDLTASTTTALFQINITKLYLPVAR